MDELNKLREEKLNLANKAANKYISGVFFGLIFSLVLIIISIMNFIQFSFITFVIAIVSGLCLIFVFNPEIKSRKLAYLEAEKELALLFKENQK